MTLNGTTVSAWADQSGTGNNAAQGTASKQPTFVGSDAQFGGLPVLDFDGSNDQLNWSSFPDPGTGTADGFFVLRADADPQTNSQSCFGTLGNEASGAQNLYTFTDGVAYMGFASTARKNTGNPATGVNTTHLLEMISASGEWTMNINGTQHFTTGTNTYAWLTTPRICESGAASRWWAGRIAEIAIFSRKLTASERTWMNDYARARYNLPF